ncbi:hypothetical protein TSUD_236160 [Trifolium subterraneum]|nr:hypothetical protein TSUD_236160 [Trifolium subterraneum]
MIEAEDNEADTIYPLRPSWRPYELDERCEEVRLKPDSSEAEVDLSVDFESSNIDSDVSKKLKYTKQLHLHSIHAVVQLRPSQHYLDSGGSEKKNVAMSNQNNPMKPSTSNGDQVLQLLKQ